MSAHEYEGQFVGRGQRLQTKITGKRGGMKSITLERLEQLLKQDRREQARRERERT
jgi:hypothetical protein